MVAVPDRNVEFNSSFEFTYSVEGSTYSQLELFLQGGSGIIYLIIASLGIGLIFIAVAVALVNLAGFSSIGDALQEKIQAKKASNELCA